MLSMIDAGCVGSPVERRQSRIYMVREPFNEPRTGTPPRGASDPPGTSTQLAISLKTGQTVPCHTPLAQGALLPTLYSP